MFMTKSEALRLLYHYFEKYNLKDWQVSTSAMVRFNATTYLNRKLIKLSSYLLKLNPPEFVHLTILHEVAHAIAFERHGCADHGEVWQQICREIGGDPARGFVGTDPIHGTAVKTNLPQRWAGECCGQRHTSHKKKKDLVCGECGKNVGLNRIKQMVIA